MICRRSMILCLLCVRIAEVGCNGDRRDGSIIVRRRYRFHFLSAVVIASVMTFNSDAPGRRFSFSTSCANYINAISLQALSGTSWSEFLIIRVSAWKLRTSFCVTVC